MVSFLVYFCLNLLTYKMYMKNMKLKVLLVLCALLLLSAFIAERKDPITIFMIGDSTMANKSLKNGNIERGLGQMLLGYFTEDNHAMNG